MKKLILPFLLIIFLSGTGLLYHLLTSQPDIPEEDEPTLQGVSTPSYFKRRGDNVLFVRSNYQLGSDTTRTAYGWFTDLNATNSSSTNATSTILHVSESLTVGAYTLPNTDGNANDVLKTDGSGVLTWQTDNTGAGGSSNWEFGGADFIKPTSTVGLIVSASSTIQGDLTIDGNLLISGNNDYSDLIAGDIPDLSATYLLEGESDVMTGTLTADGLTLGSTELLTIGSQTLTHDGTDFVFNDSLLISGVASSTGFNTQGSMHIGTNLTVEGTLTGEASTATALAGNGGNCNAGEYALGVDASGAVESCTDATTEINSVVNGLGGTNLTCSGQSCNVDDAFLVNDANDTMVGILTADGLTLGANENITLGSQTLDHDGTTFVFNDDISITGTATSTNAGNLEVTGNVSSSAMFLNGLLDFGNGMCIGEDSGTTTPNVTIQNCSDF